MINFQKMISINDIVIDVTTANVVHLFSILLVTHLVKCQDLKALLHQFGHSKQHRDVHCFSYCIFYQHFYCANHFGASLSPFS